MNRMKDLGNKAIMAKNIDRLMREQKASAKEISRSLAVPYTTFLSWKKGENYPRIDKIEAMAAYFGVLKSDLIEDKTAQEKPVIADGLTGNQKKLIDFAMGLTEDQAEKVLRLMQSIVAFDE